LLFSFAITFSSFAQIPGKPEGISPLLIGETIPDLNLKSSKSQVVNIKNRIMEKPTVLIFYRGGWCPYCNKQLSGIAEVESEILKLGYQIIAVSPDQIPKLSETEAKSNLNYQLLSDSACILANAMGIVFNVPNHYLKVIDEASGGKNKELLPVPAVFVLNTKGEIDFEYINPNFKNRLTSKLLMAVLKGLN
jgi:peroxiredoxin